MADSPIGPVNSPIAPVRHSVWRCLPIAVRSAALVSQRVRKVSSHPPPCAAGRFAALPIDSLLCRSIRCSA
eukprot:1181102-Prorocentrum_minimum.AAC.1